MGSVWQEAGSELGRRVRMAGLAAAGLVLIGVAGLLGAHPAATFFSILSLIGTGVAVGGIVFQLRRHRRAAALIAARTGMPQQGEFR